MMTGSLIAPVYIRDPDPAASSVEFLLMTLDSEKTVKQLDDVADREELRNRYDLLLQEVRVALPGVQILLAFLLTIPFAQQFDDLDTWGRRAYGVALTSSMLSVICLMTPAVLHRLGRRTARTARLLWSIRLQVLGLGFLGIALLTGLWAVARFVYGTGLAWCITLPTALFVLACWVVLPLSLRRQPPIF
jgi:Family of unknown function (DUF6328)